MTRSFRNGEIAMPALSLISQTMKINIKSQQSVFVFDIRFKVLLSPPESSPAYTLHHLQT